MKARAGAGSFGIGFKSSVILYLRMLKDRLFWLSRDEEIKQAKCTDAYFRYTLEVMRRKSLNPRVVMEVYARTFPDSSYTWGILLGTCEVARLLEGLPVTVKSMEEGEVFLVNPRSMIYEPVMRITGKYADICLLETSILGFLAVPTGVATKAARFRILARDKVLFGFGSRRTHPALAPTVERAVYIAGFNGVSNVLAAELMGMRAVGTMPHALIQVFGSQEAAWRAYDESLPSDVPRIALVDTFYDEKAEAIMALEKLGERLHGVRLDTPRSRRGDFRKIVEEVRWELNARGGRNVKIFVSGGIDEDAVSELVDLVDGFGVGTNVSAAPSVDFSMKIVAIEREGRLVPLAKRGDIGGVKAVYRNYETMSDIVTLEENPQPEGTVPLLKDLLVDGKIVRDEEDPSRIREKVLRKLEVLRSVEPKLTWI
ncbi:MAG: nicotinate phosphoribosyltransferase [Thermoproteota archaeon]